MARVVGLSSMIALSKNLTSKTYQKSVLAHHLKTSRPKRPATCTSLGSVTRMPICSFTNEFTPRKKLKKSPLMKYHLSNNLPSLCPLSTTLISSCMKVTRQKLSMKLFFTRHPRHLSTTWVRIFTRPSKPRTRPSFNWSFSTTRNTSSSSETSWASSRVLTPWVAAVPNRMKLKIHFTSKRTNPSHSLKSSSSSWLKSSKHLNKEMLIIRDL